jgi:hypothetical protein
VAESPLAKLVRLVGGVALSYGSLGHQVLGQLITLNAKEVELAAAATLIAATSRQPNALVYSVVRVLGPAVAVHLMTKRELGRLGAVWQRLEEKERRISEREAEIDSSVRSGSSRALRGGQNRHRAVRRGRWGAL